MSKGPFDRTAGTTIVWRTCPRCGALGPHTERSGSARTVQSQCCRVLRFSPTHAVWPDDPIWNHDPGDTDESDNP